MKQTENISNKKCSRCSKCLKKTLMLSNCKCNNEYCLNCLPFYSHDCKFDWRKNNKNYLENNNPVIQFSKVNYI